MRKLVAGLGVLVALAAVVPPAHAQAPSSARALARALRRDMSQIGGASGAYVVDLTARRVLFSDAAGVGRIPASVQKLYTTATALLRFGAAATLETVVLGRGWRDSAGVWHGTLYLRGGGDPTFGSAAFDRSAYGGYSATVQRLVASLRRVGITGLRGAIVGDESYFDSRRGTSESGYRPDLYMEGELSALAFNRGFANPAGTAYQRRPALYAAQQLAGAMRAAGMQLPRRPLIYTARTPAGSQPLARVTSPRIARLLALTNTPSDNFFAEMLLKGLGARFGSGGTTAAGAAVVRAELAHAFGIHPYFVDGSGLSYADSTSPLQVVMLLSDMAANQVFVDSLAVAGETGTLQDEARGTPAQGSCHGKTGTLSDVANLAGYCLARDGHTLAFAVLANSVTDTAHAHAVEGDEIAPALAAYDG
jgi:D-alanyl-D-alanine carboxypeptidase/D-alanyl-D-alanine-endopeptidase (penicillin-binding protein 4)